MGDALFLTLDGELVCRTDLLKAIEAMQFAADMLLTTTPEDYRNIYTDHIIKSFGEHVIWSPERYQHEYKPGVYFFHCDDRIKIGQTADFNQRIRKLRYEYGSHSKMLAMIEVSDQKHIEKLLHQRFSHLRVSGDWFSPVNEIVEWLEGLRGA